MGLWSRLRNDDLGKLLLRVAAGGLMIPHGIHKLNHGHDFIAAKLAEAGLPEFFALGVPVGEVVAPFLMVIGLGTRISSLIVAFTMLMSIFLVFSNQIFSLNQNGGLVTELNLLFLVSCLAVFFLGAGKFAVDAKLPKRL